MSWIDKIAPGRGRRKAQARRTPLDLTLEAGAAPNAPAAQALNGAPRQKVEASEPAFPHFHITAHDQVDPRAIGEADALRIRFRNTFTPAQPITNRRMFAGRREILTTLIGSLEDERLHVILYGDRGIGKTSLLHVLAQAARDAKYLVAYIPCGSASSFNEIFRTVAAEIPLLFHRDFGPTSPEAERGDTFASLLGESPVSGRKASELSAKVTDTRVLVILDEFDRSEDPDFRRDITEFLKNLSDQSVRLQLVIAGVAGNLGELLQNRTIINRNIFAFEAPRMTPEEVGDLVAKGEAASGLAFSHDAKRMIVAIANGLPYAASLLSHRSGLAALAAGRKVANEDDVSAAVNQIINDVHLRLSSQARAQLHALPRNETQALLEPLAAVSYVSGGAFDEDDIRRVHPGSAAAEKCAALVKQLVDERHILGVVSDDLGVRYRFLDENVPYYLWLRMMQRAFSASDAVSVSTA